MEGWGVFLVVVVLLLMLGGGGYVGYAHYRARKLGLPPPALNPFSKNPRELNPTYRAPAPAPGGVRGWIADAWASMRNLRASAGAYESAGPGARRGGAARGRALGPLDPDEAWDARVDNEASGYNDEQELGLQDPAHGPYGGGGYGNGSGGGYGNDSGGYGNGSGVGVGGIEAGRGRSRSRQRELDDRYDQEVHGARGAHGAQALNPFGDAAEPSNMSLRSASPRPHEHTSYHGTTTRPAHQKQDSSVRSGGSTDNSPTGRTSMFTEDV